jgi:hypothetical protein
MASKDEKYLAGINTGEQTSRRIARIASLFDVAILQKAIDNLPGDSSPKDSYQRRIEALKAETVSPVLQLLRAARIPHGGANAVHKSYAEYRNTLLEDAQKL